MTIAEMIEQAHENAKAKGFWDTLVMKDFDHFGSVKNEVENAMVAQKLALISTEIAEFEAEARERRTEAMLEELADVVIRVFDLCGHLGVALPEDVLTTRLHMFSSASGLALVLYRKVALAVQSNRKERHDFALHIELIVRYAQDFSCGHYANAYALRNAIEEKMRKNETREHRHGAAY